MTIRKLMAGYGERLDADDLMTKDRRIGGGPKEGIANLRNKRYVVGSELQDGRRLDVSLIKDISGGESVKARRLYEHDQEFFPTFKLWLYGNHKPVILDSTLSIWRRMKQIPFEVTIPNRDVNPNLPAELEAEMAGILAWAVRGCLDWQKYGLAEPDAVTTATAGYRHDSDILGDFLEDCCIFEPLATIAKSRMKEAYQQWCAENGTEPITRGTFKSRLTEKGITDGRSTDHKTRIWCGIRLRTEDDPADISDKTDENSCLGDKTGRILPESPLIEKNKKTLLRNTSQNVLLSENGQPPEYPTEPCRNCGSDDYWLREGAGKAEWLCCQCHPQPKGKNNADKELLQQ
jgi:putative DNA primase/helicase